MHELLDIFLCRRDGRGLIVARARELQLVQRYTVRTYRGSKLLSEVDTEEYEVVGLQQTFVCYPESP